MLLGYARGKVGSLVFSRLKGQQITKAHNANPANPKTYNQMIQRVVLASGVALFKLAQSKFFKFAFEDKKVIESDYNAFIRKNITLFPYVEKEKVKGGFIPVDELVVSSGSLGQIQTTIPAARIVQDLPAGRLQFIAEQVSDLFQNLTIANATVGAVSTKIISNSGGRLQNGDLLTFVVYACSDDGTDPVVFGYSQFKLDTASTALTSANSAGMIQVGEFDQGTNVALIQTGFLTPQVDTTMAVAGAIIVTRKEGSAILASDSVMAANTAMSTLYAAARTDSAKTTAAASYGAKEGAILNPQKY